MRDVLNRVIPSLLIVVTTICRANVKRVVCRAVVPDAECDAHKAPCVSPRAGCRRPGDLRLDDSVGEFEFLNGSQLGKTRLFVGCHALESAQGVFGVHDSQPLLSFQHRRLGGHLVEPQACARVEWVALCLSGRRARKKKHSDGGEREEHESLVQARLTRKPSHVSFTL